jgi:PKD repeat protein
VLSAYYTSNTATASFSGTSMSSPHVAGAIALYLDANPTATPAQVSQALKDNASLNKISLHSRSRRNGTANRLLFVGTGGGGTNIPPTAGFTFSCTGLSCVFTNTSTDDKPGMTFAWTFGDGGTSNATSPSHTYAAANTYQVVLTTTDSDGAIDTHTENVPVSSGGGGGFQLSATGYKVKGVQHADLTWSGGPGGNLDVLRNGVIVGSPTPDDGAFTDNIGNKGGGSYTYRVCSAGGTATCSNTVTVTF